MAYVRTRGLVLRRGDYSETSQVAALITPDLGQVHVLAKGSRRVRKDGRMPLDLLTHLDVVLARRAPGQLHVLADWSLRETFRTLRENLRRFWIASYAGEVVLTCTSENADDGAAYGELLHLLSELEADENEDQALVKFLTRFLQTIGSAPITDRCAQCGGTLSGLTRFSPKTGGALCSHCDVADPTAFSVSRGALAVMTRLAAAESTIRSLRITAEQVKEIQRAFYEQIEYHLGRPLRTWRFLRNAN